MHQETIVSPARHRLSSAAVAALVLALCACGGGTPAPEIYTLSDGAVVQVGHTGDIQIAVDDRVVFATSATALPQARRFNEEAIGPLAIWRFERRDEEIATLDTLVGSRQEGDSVIVELTSSDGRESATLTISPERAATSRVVFDHQSDSQADSLVLSLACSVHQSFYGFGEQYNALNQRGEAFPLWVSEQGIERHPLVNSVPINGDAHTTYFPMPYFLDAAGSGALIRTHYRVEVDLCAGDEEVASFEVLGGQPMEWVVFHGPGTIDVIEQLSEEVGRPKAPPAWAYELWIGAQGGTQAILDEADALEAAGIPAKVLWVQDWTGVRPNFGGGSGVEYRWRADIEHYPDLAGTIAGLQGRGYRFLTYANPFIDVELEHFPEMAPTGMLIHDPEGAVYEHVAPNGTSSHPDLTNPVTREYVKDQLRAMVTDYGMDGWMADFGEWIPVDAVLFDGSDAAEYHNRYPIDWHTMSREVMDEVRPDGDWVVFARSGHNGVHQVSQIHWVGDQEADFSPHDGLPTVVPAMLNLGLSGIPYVTHDIAGFSGGPSTKELYLRWTELGAFTPIMRTHEGNNKLENWNWDGDPETIAHFRRFALVHQALIPEIRELAAAAEARSTPIVRPLMMVFPDDPESAEISDQFMLGDELLVAPVVEEGAATRDLYLPPGTWYHVWTGDAYTGGTRLQVDAPIGSPPVFALGADRDDLRAIQ